jgi:type I restriction enzyme S subunit
MKEFWELKKIGDVCEIQNGGTPKTGTTEYWDGEIKWITPKDLGKLKSKYVNDTPRKITTLGLQKSSAKLIPESSIILSTRAPIGHLAINTSEMATNQGCRGVIPSNSIDTHYLYYFLFNSVKLLNDLGTGATFKELSTKALSSVPIPLPPLTEQKRIVAILDKAFAAIDKAKANAEQNLKNARELFESYLKEIFSNNIGWEKKILNEITEVKDGTHDSPKYVKHGIPFVTQKNIKLTGLTLENTKYISDIDHEKFYKRSNVAYGDILISMIGANRGMASLVENKTIFSIKNVGLIKKTENISMSFLLYYLKSPIAKQYVSDMSKGGAQEFIGLTSLRNFPVPYPKFDKQEAIVNKLNALKKKKKRLEKKLFFVKY